MQNKHQFFFLVVGVPTFGDGRGVKPVGTKSQVWPKFFWTAPLSLQWKENRVRYQNLKKETFLNALTDDDIETIWLPLIVYDNTDQKEVTRLGTEWEWATRVTVTREGNFTWSSWEEVDEAEIFEGAENSLTMNQTYTREFQCKYKLQRYPFDAQVTD